MEAHWLRRGLGLPENIFVVGVDPGTRVTGTAFLWADTGYTRCLPGPRDKPWFERVYRMFHHFTIYLNRALCGWIMVTSAPQKAVVFGMEMPAVYAGQGNTAIKLGDIRGALYIAMRRAIEEHETVTPHFHVGISPKSAKVALAEDGNASLGQMMAAARQWWWPETDGIGDEAIALGIAMAAWKLYQGEEAQ